MIRTSWLSAMAIVAAGCPAAALADDEPLVVTASRRPLAAEQLPYWVKVVEGPDLEEAESLDAALARLPDVYIQAPGARTGFASLFLRGADPNFTVVMLEGVPLNSPTNSRGGAVNLAAIPAAAIGRAELVAGSASTLYGSGALAGALNLLLPEPTPRPRLSFAGAAGTEGEISGLARWQGPIARGWGATLSALADDAGSATPLSGFASRGLDLLFASQRDSRDRAVVHFAKSRSHGWPDNSGGPMFATRDDLEVRSGKELVLSASHALARFASGRLALSASYLERDDAVTSPGVDASPFSPVGVPAGYDATHYRSIGLRPTLDWTVGEWRATLGVAAQWERGASDGYLDFGIPVPSGFDLRRTTRSVFADLDRVAGPVTFEAGLRFDSVEDGASRTTGRIGLRAALTDRLALKANAGTAWKAPSFYALANPFVGNPDLEPESGSSVELGLEQSFAGDGTLAVTVFRSRYRNLIDFVPGDVPRLENRSIVEAQGVASALGVTLVPDVRLELSAQYVDTSDPDDSAPLLHRPRWRAGGSLQWRATDRLDVRLRHAFTDKRYDFANPTGLKALDPSHEASLAFDWRPDSQTRFRVVVDNLLDERVGGAIGHAALPRRVRLGLSRSFE